MILPNTGETQISGEPNLSLEQANIAEVGKSFPEFATQAQVGHLEEEFSAEAIGYLIQDLLYLQSDLLNQDRIPLENFSILDQRYPKLKTGLESILFKYLMYEDKQRIEQGQQLEDETAKVQFKANIEEAVHTVGLMAQIIKKAPLRRQ